MAEIERLTVVWDANYQKLDEKLNKVIRSNYGAASKIEKQWATTNDNLAQRFAKNGVGQGLESLASRAPVAAASLGLMGPAGIAAGIAMAGFAAAMNKAAEAAQFADDLSAAATKVGITAEALQELRYAAEANDIPIADLDESLQGLNASIGALQSGVGAGKLTKVFAALGIGPAELANIQTADQLLPLLADKLGKLGSQAQQVQIAKKLGIEALLPLLQQGGAGVDQLRQKARDLNLVMSETSVQGAAAMNEELRVAGEQAKTAGNKLAVEFIPTLVEIKKAAAGAAGALAGMFAFVNRIGKADPNELIQDQLRYAQAARSRAAKLRTGSTLDAASTGVISGLGAFSPQARARAAAEQDAAAARADRQVEAMSLRQQREAQAAADKAAAAAQAAAGRSSPLASSGAGGGKSRAAKADSGPSAEEIARTRELGALREQLELFQAAANDRSIQAMQDHIERLEKINQYRKDGLNIAEATAKADAFVSQRGLNRDLAEAKASLGEDRSVAGLTTTAEAFQKMGDDLYGIDPEREAELRAGFRDAFTQGLQAAAEGGFGGVVEMFGDRLKAKLMDRLADTVFDLLKGAGGGGGGGSGSWISTALKFGAKIFTGHNAMGTDNWRGGETWVGETGPEKVNLPRGAQVVPANVARAQQARATSFAPSIHQHITMDNRGAMIWEQESARLMALMNQTAARAGYGAVQTARQQTSADFARRARRSL